MKKITIVITLLALSLTVKAQTLNLECGMSEVRAFKHAVTPDENSWTRADGRIVDISMNPALFALLGEHYGGDAVRTFALPKIEDIQLNGQSYGYYICTRGIWPTQGTESANTGFLRQYAGRFLLQTNREILMLREETLPIEIYIALASFLNQDLIQDNNILVPTVTLPAVLKDVPAANQLRNLLELIGNYPAHEIFCEKGGLYFALGKMSEPVNAKEIVADGATSVSYGNEAKVPAHIYECL